MAKLIYSAISSLDGYVADAEGKFDWSAPDEEMHAFVERDFDPGAIRELKASAGADLSPGGPHLAAQALEAGLVDECHLFLSPVVGGGNQALPDGLRLELELLDECRFGNCRRR